MTQALPPTAFPWAKAGRKPNQEPSSYQTLLPWNRHFLCRRENKAKKKLPQAGQEPVEAVESERSGPDTGYHTRFAGLGKDIMQKICHNFAERLWE
jgi:hypothetical protein